MDPEAGRSMSTLLIEYRVEDPAAWKTFFDRDPLRRSAHGATGHRVYRDSDDRDHLLLSLEFPSEDDARTFLEELRPVWDVSGARRAWVLQQVEEATY
jgi:hypothetical protein